MVLFFMELRRQMQLLFMFEKRVQIKVHLGGLLWKPE